MRPLDIRSASGRCGPMADEQKNKKPDKASEVLGSLITAIPTVYYDLIARVVPGLVLWMLVVWPHERTTTPTLSWIAATVPDNIFVLILVGYATGIFLSCVGNVWDFVFTALYKALPSVRGPLGLDTGSVIANWQSVMVRMDTVASTDEKIERTLTKALAETALLQNLLTGAILATTLHAITSLNWSIIYWVGGTIVLLIGTGFRQAFFFGRVKAAHCSHVANQAMKAKGPTAQCTQSE